jgi:hypothetical protein
MLFHVDHVPLNVLALALFVAAFTGCAGTGSTAAETPSSALSTGLPTGSSMVESTPQPTTLPTLPPVAPDSCPVTIPNGSSPPGVSPDLSRHGNGALWVDLWPNNRILADPRFVSSDGSISMKFPWWRGVPGKLTIEGFRLDASAPPIEAQVSPFYGETGFQPSGILFPSEGCWQITGRVGEASLTFVTLVIKVPAPK